MRGFVGRSSELAALGAELQEIQATGEGRFVWMRGRRRVGKSRLAERFVESTGLPYVFYQAPRRAGADALERFRDSLASSTLPAAAAVRTGAGFETWRAALRLASDGAAKDRPLIVVIDELPYLVEHDHGFPSDLQEAWDRALQDRPVLLVCIGSDVRMMKTLTEYPAELHGRPTREMVVGPFSPRELASLCGIDAAQAFDRYLIVGGFPILARSWPGALSRREFLERSLADSAGSLITNALRILDAEFEKDLQARDVLEAIGHGERTFNAIRGRSGVNNPASLAAALDVLTARKGIVEASLPYAAPPGRKDRRYHVVDPYLRFWLRFIGPNLDEIDRDRSDLVIERVERDWGSYRGKAIEPVVRRSIERFLPDARLGNARHVGSYWTRTNIPEVDLVGAAGPDPASVDFVGSIKWRDNAMFNRADTRDLVEKRAKVPGAARAILVGVSRRGFIQDAGLDVELGPEELLEAWPEP